MNKVKQMPKIEERNVDRFGDKIMKDEVDYKGNTVIDLPKSNQQKFQEIKQKKQLERSGFKDSTIHSTIPEADDYDYQDPYAQNLNVDLTKTTTKQ